MPIDLQTRVVDTGGAVSNTIINRRPTCVHWITLSVQAINTQGLIQMYDGSDADSEPIWQSEPGYSRHRNFSPHICCHVACFIHTDEHIASYTVGYTPRSDAPFEDIDAE